MLAHWIYYFFLWAPMAHLLYLYLLLCLWACWLSFLPCWPIEFVTSFLGLPQSIYSTFTSCYAHGPASYHFCCVDPLDLLPLFLGFNAHLFYLYLLLCPWACWLSFLPCWPIRLITSFLGLPWSIYFAFTSFISLFLSPSPIVRLLLPLGFLSKMGINKGESVNIFKSQGSRVLFYFR